MKKNLFNDPQVRNIGYFSLLVLVESIQLVIVLGWLSTFIPYGKAAFNNDLFPVYRSEIKPNYQMEIYHIFIVASILAQAIGIYVFRRKLDNIGFQNNIKRLLIVDSLWVLAQCWAIFKILVYPDPQWAWELFYITLAASVLSRVFWVEIISWTRKGQEWLMAPLGPGQTKVGGILWDWENFLWMPLFVVVESLQVVIGFNWLWGHIKTVMPVWSFGVFILSTGLFTILITLKFIKASKIKGFIITEMLLTFFLLSALFKMIVYDYRNQLAVNAYHVLLVLSLLNKIFCPIIAKAGRSIWAFLIYRQNTRVLQLAGDGFMVALILTIVYLPDPLGVLAKIFVGEQFLHMDHFIMAPGWAYVSGCVLDVDVISRYGIGAPIVLSTLAKWIGGYGYLNILRVVMGICMIYYVLSYIFLRLWLKSFLLAAAAILMGIKVQMFYTLTLPQPLTYPSGTPVRFMLDIVFLFSIWGHLCKQRWVYLWLAALSCAFSLFYMLETGLYLTAAFYAYLLIQAITPSLRQKMFASPRGWINVSLCVLSVPVGAFCFYGLAEGQHIFTHQFWYNTLEFTQIFTQGLLTGPFYGGLQYGQFWDLLIGFSFPIVYILTILIIGTLCITGKISTKHLMAVVLSIYGLGAHHYYITLPTTNNYYMRGLPFVFVCFYWIRLGLMGAPRKFRQQARVALLCFSTYALWTNHHFLSYPNMLNFSRNPLVGPLVAEELPTRKSYFFHKVRDVPEELKFPLNSLGEKDEGIDRQFSSDEDLKEYYKTEIDFTQDAQLIRSLTAPHQPVALISSFEIEMLMQADRKPLFYYFSMVPSQPMGMRSFGTNDVILTHGQLNRVIGQLEGAESPYVFMERIFLNRQVPGRYVYENPGFMGLLDYVNTHYHPYKYGKYLVALVRNGN